ncbi:MAG: putative 5-keto-L-gluconate epimerase [Promethearchaeota archaeon]|nr:MAG: putative 5-keto-L-gluconate epimerase [Candidatus Lokiarchaeota archaeon]
MVRLEREIKMKLSIVASINEDKGSPDRIDKKFSLLCEFLKPLGYSGIELSLLKPENIDLKPILETLNSYNMHIPAIGTGGTFIRYGYSLGHRKKHVRKKAVDVLEKYMDFAAKSQSLVIIGLIRGRYSYKSNSEKEKLNIFNSLTKCIEMAEDKNVTLAFEPINRFEIDSYHTISNSLDLLEELHSNHLKILIDTFHIHLEENLDTVFTLLENNISKICHIHLADCNRRSPGSGHFPFRKLFEIFENDKYNGFYSLETIMYPSFEDVAEQSANYLFNLLGK